MKMIFPCELFTCSYKQFCGSLIVLFGIVVAETQRPVGVPQRVRYYPGVPAGLLYQLCIYFSQGWMVSNIQDYMGKLIKETFYQ